MRSPRSVAPPLYLDENVSEALATSLHAFGYDAITTAGLGRKGASDVSQLSFAAWTRRVLITYDFGHYAMLHEAWQTWAQDWGVSDRVRHPGILILPDPGLLPVADAARVVDELLTDTGTVENRLFQWKVSTGWHAIT